MSASPSVLAADGDPTGSVPDCADYWLCQQVYDWSGTNWPAENARALIATPARILLIVKERFAVEGVRTPLPLLGPVAGAAAGVR
ncbi:hypothetical protein [Geodermatophilus sp. TF02-6]|uniref:hypothetical protein n=1 Tax=Geodermatophilus sp. TF02-6 TaxID=2250575 RepID=UPI001F2A838D|nr:hypothetical protein [Geodermatophilus sp. TF02-6]